jgi:tripartite-type tricarboxylate transporter receptor subunit TctC
MLVFRTLVLRVLTAGMLIAFADVVAAQQRYPGKPIRFVVANPPGGSGDILARLVAEKLMESLGQQVVVDNRPGATGIIGTALAARALPDGYTILVRQGQNHQGRQGRQHQAEVAEAADITGRAALFR